MQISYAQTEGYVPVTTKAQQSGEYQNYLERAGEDNGLYYKIKLDATKLLLDNIPNTFVTPVFNGSASLRNAAGQLIEEARKSGKRKEILDDAYFSNLYNEITSLYRLDQIKDVALEPLPPTAVCLLGALGGAWICLGVGFFYQKMKEKRKK